MYSGNLRRKKQRTTACLHHVAQEGPQLFEEISIHYFRHILGKKSSRMENVPWWLPQAARLAQKRHRIPVVAITGSVGKTTTKEWVADILQGNYVVARTPWNSNHTWGIATTLLRVSTRRGLRVAFRRLAIIPLRIFFSRVKPDYFVLEIGTTQRGDIPRKLKMFTPTISVVTAIAPAHLEGLGSIEGIVKEKSSLVDALPETGHAVLCYDDPRVRALATRNRGHTIFYGFSPGADVWMEYPLRHGEGLSTQLHERQRVTSLFFPNIQNVSHLYAVMAAWCVGIIAGVPQDRMKVIAQRFLPPNGRGRILKGPGTSILYDESFNANPASMISALETFNAIAGKRRRILILGDMLELGMEAERLHRELGRRAAACAEIVIGVGPAARWIVHEFKQKRPSGVAYHRDTHEEVLEVVHRELRPHDAVLIKASHGIHLDKLIANLQS